MKVHALTWEQNGWCFLIGFGELIWGLVLKFVKPKYCECISMGDTPMTEDEKSRSFVSSLKRSTMGNQKEKENKGKGKPAKGDAFTKPA